MRQKDFVILFGSTCIVVMAWIGFTLYNKSVTSTLQEVSLETVKPITDSFDTTTLDKVKSRLTVEPIYALESAQVTPSPTLSSTGQQRLSPTPTPSLGVNSATQSAGVTP